MTHIVTPLGVHAAVLTDRDVFDGSTLTVAVVWADRADSDCPQCGQHIGIDTSDNCPVVLDPGAGQGGAVLVVPEWHGCGMDLTPVFEIVDDPDDREAMEFAIAAVQRRLWQDIAESRDEAD